VITDPTLEAAGADIAKCTTSAGDMVFGFGSIWSTANDDARLFRIDVS
jgi:hypothetical protein